MVRDDVAIVIEKVLETVVWHEPAASVRDITTLVYVPAVVGVPDITPVDELMERFAGNPVADHE